VSRRSIGGGGGGGPGGQNYPTGRSRCIYLDLVTSSSYNFTCGVIHRLKDRFAFKRKVKFALEDTLKARTDRIGIALLFL
jgi:hypothetical protein